MELTKDILFLTFPETSQNSELLISGTTNERGNIETTLSADYQILGCKSEKNDYYAIPYYSNATHEWWLRCKNWDDTTLYSKEVSFKVYYKPKP